MELMDRYTALTTCVEYPADYAEQLNKLALDFLSEGRYSMAETCRKRAEHYAPAPYDATVLVGECGKKLTVVSHEYIYAGPKSREQISIVEVMDA